MSNALKVGGDSDDHVLRKQAALAGHGDRRLALGRHWKTGPPNTSSANNR